MKQTLKNQELTGKCPSGHVTITPFKRELIDRGYTITADYGRGIDRLVSLEKSYGKRTVRVQLFGDDFRRVCIDQRADAYPTVFDTLEEMHVAIYHAVNCPANKSAIHGVGSWARKLAREAEAAIYWSDEEVAKREAARLARIEAQRALETPAQKAAREREEAKAARRAERASEAFSRRYWANQDREASRRSSAAIPCWAV